MNRKTAFAVLVTFVHALFGQSFPIRIDESWNPADQAYWQRFFSDLQPATAYYYPTYSLEPRRFIRGPESGWGGAYADLIVMGFGLRDPNLPGANSDANYVAAHEYYHQLQSFRGRDGNWRFVIPDIWAEALATIFPQKAEVLMRTTSLQLPVPIRSRQQSAGLPSAWTFWSPLASYLFLRYSALGATPFEDCWTGYPCPEYSLRAFPLLEAEQAVCGAGIDNCSFFPELHRILRQLSEQADRDPGPYRSIRQSDILEELDRAFPGILVHSLPLPVYIQAQPTYQKPPAGTQYSIWAMGSWYRGNQYIGDGPVNPTRIGFSAGFNRVSFVAEDPPRHSLAQTKLARGRFWIEARDQGNALHCLGSQDCRIMIDLSANPGGTVLPLLKSPSSPGRYRILARDEAGKIVVENLFWVAADPFSVNPIRDGGYIWERWPALELQPRRVELNASRPAAELEVRNLNPLVSEAWGWNTKDQRAGDPIVSSRISDDSWLTINSVSGHGPSRFAVAAKPGLNERREAAICVHAQPGISVSCAQIVFTPR